MLQLSSYFQVSLTHGLKQAKVYMIALYARETKAQGPETPGASPVHPYSNTVRRRESESNALGYRAFLHWLKTVIPLQQPNEKSTKLINSKFFCMDVNALLTTRTNYYSRRTGAASEGKPIPTELMIMPPVRLEFICIRAPDVMSPAA